MIPKVPRTPPEPLEFRDDDITEWRLPIFRVHRIAGQHPARWNEFRTFGPISDCRWDHHPPEPADYPDHGIIYAASNPQTALAEVFQKHRLIRVGAEHALSGWDPVRPLRLLDLTSNWPVRNRAGRALLSAPKAVCRAWARAIFDQAPTELDGLLTDSTLTGKGAGVLVLWSRSGPAFPPAPAMSMPLDSPALSAVILDAALDTGYQIG